MEIKHVDSPHFAPYGRVLGVSFESGRRPGVLQGCFSIDRMRKEMEHTPVPEDVIYVACEDILEECGDFAGLVRCVFGGLPIQAGYCNGHNDTLNALEYHRCSEVDIAVSDLILMVGRQQDVTEDLTYDTSKVEAFFVPAGTAVELYGTTLHYAPCGVDGAGFRCVILLPVGTNAPLPFKPSGSGEEKLLYAVNKWLLAHPDAGIEGAHEGLCGENICLDGKRRIG